MAAPDSWWQSLPLGKGVKLLRRDSSGLAALEKPPGVLSHPNDGRDQPRSLLDCRYDQVRECFICPGGDLFLLNRLDSATSGVVLVCADAGIAAAARAQFAQRGVKKVYMALVFGVPRAPTQVWRDNLSIQRRGGTVRAQATAGGQHGGSLAAETHMRTCKTIPGPPAVTLIELQPGTGRTHQLRVQCQRRRLPIVGDANYGDFNKNRAFAAHTGHKRLFLHALHIALDLDIKGKTWRFEATSPLPPEFDRG